MWSVCSGFLSDCLVWSPAVVLLRTVRSRLSFSVHVLVISGLSLWIPGCLHQQSSPSPLQCPRCHGLLIHLRPTILTILCIHSLPCTINSLLHLLLDLLSGSYSERHERINVEMFVLNRLFLKFGSWNKAAQNFLWLQSAVLIIWIIGL